MANFADAGVRLVAKDLGKFESDIGKADKSVGGFAKNAAKNGAKMALAVGASMAGVGLAVGAVSVKAAIGFESAWAGVMKTTDGLGDSVNDLTADGKELQDGFRDLAKEVPTAVEELMEIGELGGQLGVQKKNLLNFTRTVAALGETTNLTTEAAATGFARFSNIMGTPQEQFENLASTVVFLGNNFATTESDILSFGERIAGAGAIAGLAESDVFAIGAAMSSVGVQAEAGGTAVQKVLLAMNEAAIGGGDQMEIFAAVSGLSADEFGAAWEEDAGGVFNDFVQGLGIAGDDALGILSALGLEDQRLIRSFLSLAGAGELLEDAMNGGNKAFEEGKALQREANMRYQTTEAQMQILKNTVKDVGISIGQALLPFVNDLLASAKPLIESFGKKLPGFMKKIVPIIKNLVKFGGKLISIFSGLVQGIVHVFKEGELLHMGDFIPGFQEFPQLVQDIINKVREVFVGLIDFVLLTVIPGLQKIGEWLGVFLPQAAAVLIEIWQGILVPAIDALLPAIANLVSFVQDNLVPILSGIAVVILGVVIPAIVSWAAANVAAAIATITAWLPIILMVGAVIAVVALLVKAWQNDLGGIQTKTREVWETTIKPIFERIKQIIETVVIPAVGRLVDWLKIEVPKAFEAIKRFWLDTLQPALKELWGYIKENIIPIIEDAVDWLGEKIPEAFTAIQTFWVDTLLPTLEELWAFVRDNIIPIIEDAFDWLSIKIPEAFETVKSFWLKTLQPALKELWEFVRDNIIPIVELAVDWLKVKVPEAFEEVKKFWEETLKPTFQKIVDFIMDPLIKTLKLVVDWIVDKFIGAFKQLRQWWTDHGEEVISLIAGGIGMITEALRDVVEWVGKAIDWLGRLKMPDISLPSLPWQDDKDPDPVQQHRGGFWPGGGMAQLHDDEVVLPLNNRAGIDALSKAVGVAMERMAAPSMVMPRMTGAAVSNNSQANSFNTTINNEMDMRVFEQRVLQIVNDSLG